VIATDNTNVLLFLLLLPGITIIIFVLFYLFLFVMYQRMED